MMPFYDTVLEKSAARENSRVSGGARIGKQGECIDTHDFCARRGRQKCLLGSLPKPGTSGHFVPKSAAQAPYICVTVAYRSCSLFFCPSVRPSRWSMFVLTATASRISRCAFRYSAYSFFFRAARARRFLSARPFSAALPRPAVRSWQPSPPGNRPAPPHARPDTSCCTGPPCTHRIRGEFWRTAPPRPSVRRCAPAPSRWPAIHQRAGESGPPLHPFLHSAR